MAIRRAGVIGLAVLAATPASAAAAPLVDPVSVSRSVSVPSGASRSLTLACPGTAVALHGATTDEPGSDSVPGSDVGKWTFRFTTPAGDPDRRVGAILRCVRLRLPAGMDGVRLVVGTVRLPRVQVAAGSTRRVELGCRRGLIPTGWGVARSDLAPTIAVAAARPTRRGFAFRLENTSDDAAMATPRMRCLGRTQRADDGRRHSFRTRIASFRDSGSTAEHSCRRSEYSLATGVRLDPAGDALLDFAHPIGERGGRWSFDRAGAARTSLVCLARRTRFASEATSRRP